MNNIEFSVGTTLLQTPKETLSQDMLEEMEKKLVSAAKAAKKTVVMREKNLEDRLAKAEQFVDAGIKDIQAIVGRFQNILAAMDTNTWRANAEATYRAGKEQTEALQQIYIDLQKSVKDSCTRTNQVSAQLIKGASKALNNIHPTMFQQLIDDSSEQINKAAKQAMQHMTEAVKWFHWKNLATVFFITLLITSSIGMYINAEWPWESHKNAIKQRNAGQALVDTWYQLSQNDQRLVISDIDHNSATA